jgi:hypothetical protein
MAAEQSPTGSAAGQVAGVVVNEANQVAGMTRDESRDVMDEAKHQATSMMHDLSATIQELVEDEASKFAQSLHDAGRQMLSMADTVDDQSLAAGVVRESARAAERLASHLDAGGLDRAMADVRSYARRNPGGFLLGAAVAGFVLGRVARNLPGQRDGHDTAGMIEPNDTATSPSAGAAPGDAVPGLNSPGEASGGA